MVDDRLAEVAELADALDSESSARNGRGGSNPLFGTRCHTRTYVDLAFVLFLATLHLAHLWHTTMTSTLPCHGRD